MALTAAVVGGGIGGVAAAVELKRAGITDFVVLERSDRLGGVWRANTYPGVACDVPSHLYALSFAPNARWSRRFAPGAEIQAYVEDVARRFGVDEHVRFGAEVVRAAFDEQAGSWRLELAGGERVLARVLVAACGQLARPKLPALPGLERFAGTAFHSAEWDADRPLDGRRVAVLGSGSSAVQIVPAIAPRVAALTVFQRSAPWTLPKMDVVYGARTQRRNERWPRLLDLKREAWSTVMESQLPMFSLRPRGRARALRTVSSTAAHVQRFVQVRGNRDLLRATRPDYPMGCKRVCVTSDWYPTMRRSNVELVTEAIREVQADAIVDVRGRRHPVDAIILGTGFTATEFLAPMEVEGRGGVALRDAWAGGAEAYLGIVVPRFPNLFLLYGPTTNRNVGSATGMIEAQARYVADAVGLIERGTTDRLEVRQAVHDAYQAEMAERLGASVWSGCSSWYVTPDGRVTTQWPGSYAEYDERTRRVALDEFVTGRDG